MRYSDLAHNELERLEFLIGQQHVHR
jgi:hypothetical protein